MAMVTDYDVWAEKPVNVAEVIRTMNENAGNISRMVEEAVNRIHACGRDCGCQQAADEAGM